MEDLRAMSGELPAVREAQAQLEAVREEYERYKLRAQSVLKNKSKV